MITLLYRMIILFILGCVLVNIFIEKDVKKQANNALIVIPLLLRAFMIK